MADPTTGLVTGPTVITQTVDPELSDSFAKYFAEEDAKSPPVEAPSVEPAHEPPSGEPEHRAEEPDRADYKVDVPAPPKRKITDTAKAPSTKDINEFLDGVPEPEVKAAAPSDQPKDDIDTLEPHPAASDENKSHFGKLKDVARRYKDVAQVFKRKLTPLLGELSDDPAQVSQALDQLFEKAKSTPTTASLEPAEKDELEYYRRVAIGAGINKNAVFRERYQDPISQQHADIVDDLATFFGNDWAAGIKQQFNPQQAGNGKAWDPAWYQNALEMAKNTGRMDKTTYDRLSYKIARESELVKVRDREEETLIKDPDARQRFTDESGAMLIRRDAEDYQKRIRKETDKILKEERPELGKEILPEGILDEATGAYRTDGIADPKARAAAEQKNQRWHQLNQRFSNVVSEFQKGPENAGRMGLHVIELEEYCKQLSGVNTEYQKFKAEKDKEVQSLNFKIEQLEKEVDNKRDLRGRPLRPTSGNGSRSSKQAAPSGQRLTQSKNADFSTL